MDVEIDDRRARDAVLVLRVAGGDAGVVEKAKSHRARGFGVMAGRPRGDKGIGGLLATTSSTAWIAPPAARSAASKLPGDIEVSASRWTMPSAGVASRKASM